MCAIEARVAEGRDDRTVVILSADAVAAALLGALVETLGCVVRFRRPPESPDDSLRRTRARIALIDCEDATCLSDDVLGRARMRGVGVVIFGKADALERVRALALEHRFEMLLMPPDPAAVGRVLARVRS
jgi:hypothetical protein